MERLADEACPQAWRVVGRGMAAGQVRASTQGRAVGRGALAGCWNVNHGVSQCVCRWHDMQMK